MPPRLIQLKAAAEMLSMTADELNDYRSRNEIYGYRDGATWKFKFEEIERFAESQGIEVTPEPSPSAAGGSGIDADLDELTSVGNLDTDEASSEEASSLGDAASILVSEETLGESGGGGASTIIGKSGDDSAAADSDIQLASDSGLGTGSDVELVAEPDPSGSGVKLAAGGSDVLTGGSGTGSNILSDAPKADSPSATANLEGEGDMGDLSLGESGLALGDDDLALGEDSLDLDADDIGAIDLDAVVTGSGAGSDVTGGAGDSGINLANPSESGLSLEGEPLELGGSAVESLELGEDDMVPLEEEAADPDAATQLKADDDFLLTPVEDVGGEESDSGSQVIALDTEEFDESAEGLLAADMGAEPFLEEEAVFAGEDDMGGAAALAGAGAASLIQPKQAVEAPYSIWNVLSLMFIVLLLGFTGILMVDLVRNMWTWDGPYAGSSPIMDKIIEMIGGKP
jgi:hypothetical protein